jgi:hypothetical protein
MARNPAAEAVRRTLWACLVFAPLALLASAAGAAAPRPSFVVILAAEQPERVRGLTVLYEQWARGQEWVPGPG